MATAQQPVFVLTKSPRAGKRFRATLQDGRKIDFGAKDGETYIDHGNDMKRLAWLARHGAPEMRERWNAWTPAAMSRWVLWEHKNLAQAVSALGGVLGDI